MWYRSVICKKPYAALKLVQDICSAGEAAESGKTQTALDNPYDGSYAYKTLRHLTRPAILWIRNAYARKEYLTKISSWAEGYSTLLDAGGDTAKLAAERAVALRNFGRTVLETKLSASSRAISASFAKLFGEHNHSFASILEYAKERVHLKNVDFAKLSEEELTSVYSEVVELSGVGNKFHDFIGKASGAVGSAVIALTIAALVFDIGSAVSQGKNEILSKVLEDGGELAGSLLGGYAAEAAAVALFGDTELLSIMGVALFGFVGSIAGGALAGAAVLLIVYFANTLGDKRENDATGSIFEFPLGPPIGVEYPPPTMYPLFANFRLSACTLPALPRAVPISQLCYHMFQFY
ncbi:hypothetical protein LshimejAT787_1400580 [Lyophyllum shimeji]|uniref:Uncharacterized protein n=1 Tax=Lyophyllum shimeji TaxID=47721 RepID=A0A9P3PYQ1_LYOSH|nr:hypothetical protein LshimejAT787_1400580 [Lyophyllum shimeji]